MVIIPKSDTDISVSEVLAANGKVIRVTLSQGSDVIVLYGKDVPLLARILNEMDLVSCK